MSENLHLKTLEAGPPAFSFPPLLTVECFLHVTLHVPSPSVLDSDRPLELNYSAMETMNDPDDIHLSALRVPDHSQRKSGNQVT